MKGGVCEEEVLVWQLIFGNEECIVKVDVFVCYGLMLGECFQVELYQVQFDDMSVFVQLNCLVVKGYVGSECLLKIIDYLCGCFQDQEYGVSGCVLVGCVFCILGLFYMNNCLQWKSCQVIEFDLS